VSSIGGDEQPDAAPVKAERDQIVGLPLVTPDEVLTIDGDFNSATVYAAIDAQTPGVVRVELHAELLGVRRLIASAFVVAGFTGPAISVTGIAVDGWHVMAVASSGAVRLKVGIAARRCCSGFAVFVPPELLTLPIGAIGDDNEVIAALNGVASLEGNRPVIFPWGGRQGQYHLFTSNADTSSIDFLPGSRVLHVRARSENGMIGLITFTDNGFNAIPAVLPMGSNSAAFGLELHPEGALTIRRAAWNNLRNLSIETVR